jgi:hypothetical protein
MHHRSSSWAAPSGSAIRRLRPIRASTSVPNRVVSQGGMYNDHQRATSVLQVGDPLIAVARPHPPPVLEDWDRDGRQSDEDRSDSGEPRCQLDALRCCYELDARVDSAPGSCRRRPRRQCGGSGSQGTSPRSNRAERAETTRVSLARTGRYGVAIYRRRIWRWCSGAAGTHHTMKESNRLRARAQGLAVSTRNRHPRVDLSGPSLRTA